MALQSVLKTFTGQIPWHNLRDAIQNRDTIVLDHFIGSTPALLVARLAEKYQNIVIIHDESESAQFMKGDLDALDVINANYFPPTGQQPYDDQQITNSSVVVQRSEVLNNIKSNDQSVLVTSAAALFDKIVSPQAFTDTSITIQNGDTVEFEKLQTELIDQEYEHVPFVNQPGEFARRGGILDVYPYTGDYPVRMEFFGDEVDSIREFDPDSQRSVSFLNSIRLVPDASSLNNGQKQGLLSYFDEDTVVLLINDPVIESKIDKLFATAEDNYQVLDDPDGTLPPEGLFVSPAAFRKNLGDMPQLFLGGFSQQKQTDFKYRLDSSPQPDFNGSIKLLRKDIQSLSNQGMDTYILCDNEGQRDRFEELLGEPTDQFRYYLSVESIHKGFILNEKGLAVYTDHQIFNRYHRPKVQKRKTSNNISVKELRDLNIGDYVVHVDYGVGKFSGFKTIEVRGIEQESVVLRYKEDSVLYVNVSSLHKIQKYSGKEGTQPRIDKLGSGRWARKKAETKEKVKNIARDLIELYAKRKSKDAFTFEPDNSWQTEMEARFAFEETPDQRQAIEAVKEDMESNTPMDRLICGDVGFGKTEVAVRAAFKAVMNHKQVAVLVPTTILADQHYKTFKERMQGFPVDIDVVSRFRSKKEQKNTLKRLKEGKVDIIVGTHRLTSKDVQFDEMGLLIVDEEQRFGVTAKEKLKEYRATVDVLTLTATPIPRTLQFSLMGARDLSIINTPPPNRQPVDTQIHSFNKDLIRDAITHETSRGGQVFFIHNRVKNIESVASMVRELVPDVRVRVAHGQMSSDKLENIIEDFYDHKFDVLLSTNIVENGIDISNANTMIINRADRFGLAELHQLRGRVGRSTRKAFCYLITPNIKSLTDTARKRLLALEEFSDLGAGFNIAMRDLDIRGAGDILGAEQSGFINDLGFELYQKILNDAVKELKKDEFSDVFDEVEIAPDLPETQVEFDHPALLKTEYVSNSVERLNLYRKLSGAESLEEINEWREEVVDRFGPLPEAGQNLMTSAVIQLFASRLFITKVRIRSNRMWLSCPKHSSELGEQFYGETFQELLKTMQAEAEGRFKVVQKEDRVRFVIQDIPDIKEAAAFLKELKEQSAKEVSYA